MGISCVFVHTRLHPQTLSFSHPLPQLSDTTASNVQDSLQDFVETCMPSRSQPQVRL